jgi:uncharacterized protein YcbK (DUF882 family)
MREMEEDEMAISREAAGVFDGKNMSLYTYCHHNPMILVDPDGKELVSFEAMGLTSDDPNLSNRTYYIDKKIVENIKSFIKEVTSEFSQISVNNTFRIESSDKIKTKNIKAKGLSKHQAGFAIDFNGVGTLSKIELKKLNDIAKKYGFAPIKNQNKDLPHFEADPTKFGYENIDAAVKENKASYEKILSNPKPVPSNSLLE